MGTWGCAPLWGAAALAPIVPSRASTCAPVCGDSRIGGVNYADGAAPAFGAPLCCALAQVNVISMTRSMYAAKSESAAAGSPSAAPAPLEPFKSTAALRREAAEAELRRKEEARTAAAVAAPPAGSRRGAASPPPGAGGPSLPPRAPGAAAAAYAGGGKFTSSRRGAGKAVVRPVGGGGAGAAGARGAVSAVGSSGGGDVEAAQGLATARPTPEQEAAAAKVQSLVRGTACCAAHEAMRATLGGQAATQGEVHSPPLLASQPPPPSPLPLPPPPPPQQQQQPPPQPPQQPPPQPPHPL